MKEKLLISLLVMAFSLKASALSRECIDTFVSRSVSGYQKNLVLPHIALKKERELRYSLQKRKFSTDILDTDELEILKFRLEFKLGKGNVKFEADQLLVKIENLSLGQLAYLDSLLNVGLKKKARQWKDTASLTNTIEDIKEKYYEPFDDVLLFLEGKVNQVSERAKHMLSRSALKASDFTSKEQVMRLLNEFDQEMRNAINLKAKRVLSEAGLKVEITDLGLLKLTESNDPTFNYILKMYQKEGVDVPTYLDFSLFDLNTKGCFSNSCIVTDNGRNLQRGMYLNLEQKLDDLVDANVGDVFIHELVHAKLAQAKKAGKLPPYIGHVAGSFPDKKVYTQTYSLEEVETSFVEAKFIYDSINNRLEKGNVIADFDLENLKETIERSEIFRQRQMYITDTLIDEDGKMRDGIKFMMSSKDNDHPNTKLFIFRDISGTEIDTLLIPTQYSKGLPFYKDQQKLIEFKLQQMRKYALDKKEAIAKIKSFVDDGLEAINSSASKKSQSSSEFIKISELKPVVVFEEVVKKVESTFKIKFKSQIPKNKLKKMKIVFDMDNTLTDGLGSKLRPGIIDLLEQLKADGHELVLWTHSTRDRARSIIQEAKLKKYFSKIVTREDYAPGQSSGVMKDIRKVKGDILIDDDPKQYKHMLSIKQEGFQIKPFTGKINNLSEEKELKKLYDKICRKKGLF